VGQRPDFDDVKVAKGPEENDGVLVTKSGPHSRCWIDTLTGVKEIGRLVDKETLNSYDSLLIPRGTYRKHRELAEAVFKSRRKTYQNRGQQARLFY